MRLLPSILIILFVLFLRITNAQTIDTLIDVGGGRQLHFTIIEGKGAPILFESGAGDNGSVWKDITPKIADATGATVITYDRLGFSKDSWRTPIGFGNEIKALELGLQKLGLTNRNIMLVSHSMGGMYNSYYASRHPNEVKAAVLIEAATACSWSILFKNEAFIVKAKKDLKDLTSILDSVIKHPMPLNIPILDIVAENQELNEHGNVDSVNDQIWFNCHKKFVAESPLRKSLFAYGSGHAVFVDNPPFVINAIVTQYANYLAPEQKAIILEKGYALALTMLNESNKNEVKCGRSENDLNAWAYFLLSRNEIEKAIEIFTLNTTLNPNSWNAYDSLAEAYLKAGKKELAAKNYKISLELNPKNDNATTVLEQIGK